jgi:hypothetical protein
MGDVPAKWVLVVMAGLVGGALAGLALMEMVPAVKPFIQAYKIPIGIFNVIAVLGLRKWKKQKLIQDGSDIIFYLMLIILSAVGTFILVGIVAAVGIAKALETEEIKSDITGTGGTNG